ncbi:MAG: sodium ABC transporter ATP-binding protein [Betaproteobacteria bacterium]|nr:MAG: sodium ABC transporter ATP-binding protein [Betaproteobacteria bacterium]
MIEVERLAKSFTARAGRRTTTVPAVQDVSFVARDGRITALLGPNGAGKTTTLRVLATLMKPDAGAARIGGHDVVGEPHAVRSALGVLSDARGLYTRLTARENVAYYAKLRGITADVCAARLQRFADLLDMHALLDRPTAGFSSGERMKVALARALIHDPQHLILDEPTNGLDVMSTRALRKLLAQLRAEGRCILFSTHIMQEVEQLCDEIVVVAHGRAVAHGSAAELRALTGAATLEDAFVALALESDRGLGIADCASAGRVFAEQGASSTSPGRDVRGIPE